MSRLFRVAPVLLLLSTAASAQLGALQSAAPPPAPPTAPALPVTAPGQAPAGSVGGMGDINLYPKRVVISDRERTASIGLYNRAASTGDYDITLTELVMTPEGRLLQPAAATDPALAARLRSALPLLKWSPHRVTLPANEAQMVRVMVRIPPELPPGEYRAHFNAIAVPPPTEEIAVEQAKPDGVGVHIVPRFGISIPVIVRVGETTLAAGLAGLKVTRRPDGSPAFTVRVSREGTRSAFGDLAVTAPGLKKPLAEIRGVGVYTEIAERTVQVPIDPKADPAAYARGAKLTVTYTDDDAAPGKVLARQDFTVP
jgi:hypothetical protein